MIDFVVTTTSRTLYVKAENASLVREWMQYKLQFGEVLQNIEAISSKWIVLQEINGVICD